MKNLKPDAVAHQSIVNGTGSFKACRAYVLTFLAKLRRPKYDKQESICPTPRLYKHLEPTLAPYVRVICEQAKRRTHLKLQSATPITSYVRSHHTPFPDYIPYLFYLSVATTQVMFTTVLLFLISSFVPFILAVPPHTSSNQTTRPYQPHLQFHLLRLPTR